jgi:hypothetical protein
MTVPLTSVTGESGVHGVGLLFSSGLQWICRTLSGPDFGIDAQVELLLEGHTSGRVIALQIKAGASQFAEATSTKDGWVFRENGLRLREYWLNHTDPVLLVLYNQATHTAYWQHITADTAEVTGKGFKVVVPAKQRVDTTSYRALARLARQTPPDGLSELLRGLPSECGRWLLACDETDPTLARRVASALLEGRDAPERTIDQITCEWAEAQQQAAWLAVGEYAIAYGATKTGGACFLAADQAPDAPTGSGRLRAFAGALLAGTDPDRARELLTNCLSIPDSRLLAAVAVAALDHGESPEPVRVPSEVLDDPAGAAREPTVQRFLADQRMRVGDLDAAVTHHEQALACVANSPDQQIALADALLKRASRTTPALASSDYRRAADLAETARAELRRWRGNSVPAAHLLMQIKIMAADDQSAFRVALPQPDGEATEQEAASPQLTVGAARIAYGHGDVERGDTFAAAIDADSDPAWRANLAAHRANAVKDPQTAREGAWREVLAVDDDPGRRIAACAQLAGLGCWPLTALDDINDAGLLAPGIYEVIHSYALRASGDTASALAELRRLRDSSLPAAEEYVQLLDAVGRVDDAVRAAEEAGTRFDYARLELLALGILIRARRTDEFLAKAIELLGRPGLPYRLRHAVRTKMIDEHTVRQEWARCERLGQDGLREIADLQARLGAGHANALTVPPSAAEDLAELRRQYSWMIIVTQFNQGRYDRAYQTLDELRPDARRPVEVTTWFDLHQLQDWTPDHVEMALSMAQRPEQPPELAGRILFTLMRSVPAGDDPAWADVQERLRQAGQRYLDHEEQDLPLISPDQYAALLSASNERTAPVVREAWNGCAPVGSVAVAVGRPYLLSLAVCDAGFLPAVDADPEVYRQEVTDATAALGNTVAVETTALFVAAGLLHRWSMIASEFSDALIAAPAFYDILLSQVHARALVQDGVTVSGAHGVEPLTDDIRRQVINQCRDTGDAAQSCHVISAPVSSNVDAEKPATISGPWWASVALAGERSIALYSDDAFVRARTRTKGIPTFGTVALLEALARAGRLTQSQTDDVLPTLFEHRVVDLPHAATLAASVYRQAPRSETVLMPLARRATWTAANDVTELVIGLVNHPESQRDSSSVTPLVYACASGWAAAFALPEVAIAKLLAIVLAYGTGVTVGAVNAVLSPAKMVASTYDANFLPHLRTFLIGVLTDATDRFQMTEDHAIRTVEHALNGHE